MNWRERLDDVDALLDHVEAQGLDQRDYLHTAACWLVEVMGMFP